MILYLLPSSICTTVISPSFQLMKTDLQSSKTQFLQSFLPFSSVKIASYKSLSNKKSLKSNLCCSLLEAPVIWAGRVCIFYALLKSGLAGSPSNPIVSSENGGDGADLGFAKWIEAFKGSSEEKDATNRRKLVRMWHPTTKGTLKRSYRVPSKAQGRRLLKAIASLLSEDDHFVDATSHKDTKELEEKKIGVKRLGRKKTNEAEHFSWKNDVKVPCGSIVDSEYKDSPLEYNEYVVYDPKMVRIKKNYV